MTSRWYACALCGQERNAGGLFDALRQRVEGPPAVCTSCGHDMELRLGFPFGLGAEERRVRVLGVFHPTEPYGWDNDDDRVVFYPFLVVVEGLDDGDRDVWLPYWHQVTKPGGDVSKKYGQWAPFLSVPQFADLVKQARAAGFDVD